MDLDKIVVMGPDFKWVGFQISDPSQISDHLQGNLSLTIWNRD